VESLLENLKAIVGGDSLISDAEELLVYECDGLTHYRHRPRAVVFPSSTEEVSEVLRLLARERVAVVPRGAGTGLSGGALAVGGGVCVELARMRRVLKVDVENRLAVVQTGVVNAQVSRAVARHGLHYVPDPSSQGSCTVGGNIAENAGGIHCLKYGTTTDHVLGARVVLYGGRVVELGGAGAQSTGYDLLGVFVGSEGTFGIATEARLRLTPVAPSVRTLLADFTDITDASRAVSAIIAAGILPAALEMVDGETIRAVEASVFAAGMPTDAAGALLVELDGLEAGIDEEVALVRRICEQSGARSVRLAADELERKKLWAARKGAFGAMGRISPDILIQDAVVPRSRLPEVLAAVYRVGAESRLKVANVFHAGDGNLHPLICFDSRDDAEVARVKQAGREIMETCVRAGGTITGEHGVGLDKSEYLPLVFNDDDMGAMLRVRAAFDPAGLCNPGKIIPVLKGCGEARAVVATKERIANAEGDGRGANGGGETFEDDRRQRFETESNGAFTSPSSSRPSALSAPASSSAKTTTAHAARATSPSDTSARVAFDPLRASAALAAIVGESHVAAAPESFGTNGVAPALAVRPSSVEETCEVLKLASREGWKVVPAGACNWLDAGEPLSRADVIVRTTRIARAFEHEPADLVATAGAGVTLADFNLAAARAGQWLPLDPPGGGKATLGGVAATGERGAQTFGYGAPRSYVLGMKVALADGTVIRAGSCVVKNVAGYDLCKLFVGSHGTLGLILELTFKLRPRPARAATVVARSENLGGLVEAARALATAQLLPVAVEMFSPPMARALGIRCGGEYALAARFAGTPAAVEYQVARSEDLIKSRARTETVGDDGELWPRLSAFDPNEINPAGRAASVIIWRADVLPSRLGAMLTELEDARGRTGELTWHAGAGDGRLRVFEDASSNTADMLTKIRRMRDAARSSGGALVIERAPLELKRELGAWGLSESAAFLMRRVKEQLDPTDIFSPGRFALGRG